MSQFSRTIRTSATSSGVAAVELIAGSLPVLVREIGIAIVNATASTFALGRPAAIGDTPTTPVGLLSMAPNTVSLATLAVAWGTGPTIPAAFYRQCALPAVAGSERIWKMKQSVEGTERGEIVIPAGGSLILWTLTTVSVADVYFVIEE